MSAPTGKRIERRARHGRQRRQAPPRHFPKPGADVALSIRNFSLWYGATRALHDISHGRAARQDHRADRAERLRQVDADPEHQPPERSGRRVRVEGDMLLDGESIYAPTVDVIELRKRTGMVFQRTNPFPMSIYENVVYPLRIDGENRRSVLDETVERALRARRAVGRGQGSAQGLRAGALGRPAAAPVHRARDRSRARGAADGRALQRARSDRHRAHRGADAQAARRPTPSSS